MSQPYRILIVEDDMFIAEMLEYVLKKRGFEVILAHRISQARACHEKFSPHLVILDVRLPDGDGLSFLKEIRGGSQNPSVPVLVISIFHNKTLRRQMFQAGASHYLAKPFVIQELLDGVRTALPTLS
ncbi:MAG: response regulator [Elusimicrobia bacterium]|nr:response regulator [Elusimicrobiota bacterium]